ncbi:hypothetical protein Mapa_000582 [Marchantia paleacea]|nr:hypothetical protein Mapa_000582 [Marchantia paleacea]
MEAAHAALHALATSPSVMLSVHDALHIVLSVSHRLEPVSVPLHQALGATLAEDLTAPDPLPPYPASIKDGYAVVASDGPGEYVVVGEARAGDDAANLVVKSGTVSYITTGGELLTYEPRLFSEFFHLLLYSAVLKVSSFRNLQPSFVHISLSLPRPFLCGPVPSGADAVVMIENTSPVDDDFEETGIRKVDILEGVAKGQDIRPVGSDIAEGDVVLIAGDKMGPAEIGLLATMGFSTVKVYRRPKVAVLSTGDELVDPVEGAKLGRGQIRDSNRAMLLAALVQHGCEVVDLGISHDEESELEQKIDGALKSDADMLITSGGVSMGDKDYVKPHLERRGRVYFGKVLMKPGKPVTFATIDVPAQQSRSKRQMLAFGLPGNPVSSLVCFYLFALPAIRQLSGWSDPRLRRVLSRTTRPMRLDRERPEFHRVTIHWEIDDGSGHPGFIAESTGHQVSSRLLSMRSANALLELPLSDGVLPAGTQVPTLIIGDLSNMPLTGPDNPHNRHQHHHQQGHVNQAKSQISRRHQIETHDSGKTDKAGGDIPSVKVAILTVSDTVASGGGPDRRYTSES